MSRLWTEELFGCKKPIIAMCHLGALPGDPGYDPKTGMTEIIRQARTDLAALQDGGVDGVMFSNEFSLPYLTSVDAVTVASMSRVIGELTGEIRIPFGVNVLWDPIASLDVAAATGGKFVREIFTGVYASDFGLWNTDCGRTVRHQHSIGAQGVRLLFNIVPEAASYLGTRDVAEIAKSTVFNTHADALCVSGLTAGISADATVLHRAKEAVPGTVVFANTGVNLGNIEEQLRIADGAIVATTFKYDGIFENHVDKSRVKSFMEKARSLR